MGQAMHIEHINPAGGDQPENLCLACPNCNLSKAAATGAEDPNTGEDVPLFNPRRHVWDQHFEWEDNYALLRGLTPIGRATRSPVQNEPLANRISSKTMDAGWPASCRQGQKIADRRQVIF